MNTEKLRQIIQKAGITQQELANVAGVSAPFMSFIMTGKRNPSVEQLKRIAEHLHVSIDELV